MQGSFFKKMKQLADNRVTPMNTILDESGQPLQKSEEKLEWWMSHSSETDTPQVTREEIQQAAKKLQNGKAAGGG